MSWQRALDAKADIAQFWRTDYGEEYAYGWTNDRTDTYGKSALSSEQLLDVEIGKMIYAPPMWVAPDILELILHAAKTFKPEPFLQSDIYVNPGFALLGNPGDGNPMIFRDATGRNICSRAWSWVLTSAVGMNEVAGFHLSAYSHDYDAGTDDYLIEYVRQKHETEQARGITITPWSLFHHGLFRFNQDRVTTTEELRKYHPDKPYIVGSFEELWRIVQVFFRMMKQQIAVIEKVPSPRPARKRAQRAQIEPSDVLVVRLRRPRSRPQENGGTTKDYTQHRWMVSGFWRNQWYPTLNMHRQIYINDYWKGPDGAPLILHPHKAYTWNR